LVKVNIFAVVYHGNCHENSASTSNAGQAHSI